MTDSERRPILIMPEAFTTKHTFDLRWNGWKEHPDNPLILKANPRDLFPYDKKEFEEWLAKHGCSKIQHYRKILFPSQQIKDWFLLRWP